MTGFALKAAIIVIVIALVAIVIARAFRRVPPGSGRAPAPRMPVPALLAGAALLVTGFLLALVSFTSRYTDDLMPMRIAAVAALIVGAAVLYFSARRARRR